MNDLLLAFGAGLFSGLALGPVVYVVATSRSVPALTCWRTGERGWIRDDGSCSTCGHRFCAEQAVAAEAPSLEHLRAAAPETFGGEG